MILVSLPIFQDCFPIFQDCFPIFKIFPIFQVSQGKIRLGSVKLPLRDTSSNPAQCSPKSESKVIQEFPKCDPRVFTN